MDEERVIAWIESRQTQHDCASPLEVREFAFRLKCEAEGRPPVEGGHMSRDWWHAFKKHYKDRIDVKTSTSREYERTRCRDVDVREYFVKMRYVLSQIKSPKQLINMDETGFHSRIDRERRRKCVYSKSCDTHVTYSQETASTTLSLMAVISADGETLPPMLVCRENVTFRSPEPKSIQNMICVSRTKKGYASEATMIDWINMILIPYVDKVTGQLPEPTDKVYLLMDNCGIHNSANVKPHWEKIPRVEIIWLPPHTCKCLTQRCLES